MGRKQRLAECSEQVPYWPPGPSDTESWGRIIEVYPELAPAVEHSNDIRCGDKQGSGKPKEDKESPGECGVVEGNDEQKGKLGNPDKASSTRKSGFDRKMEAREEELREGNTNPSHGTDRESGKETPKSLFCRMADGEANRMELANAFRTERLQALGNGVCPATGALALRVLFERLMGVDNEKR